MSIWSSIGSFASSFKLTDIVGDFIGSGVDMLGLGQGTTDFVTDLASGAITNAGVAAVTGGDIGEAAAYGAAGGAIGNQLTGKAARTIQGGVAGYGLDKSTGGSGWGGALSGSVGGYLSQASAASSSGSSKPLTGGSAQNGPANPNYKQRQAAKTASSTSGGSGGGLMEKLKNLGLMDEDGKGTLLGEAAASAVIGGGNYLAQKKAAEQLLEDRKERDRYQQKLELDAEQERIAAFRNPGFQVVRNG